MKIYIGDEYEGFRISASNGLQEIVSASCHYERDGGVTNLKEFFETLGFEVEYEEVC